MTTAKLVGAAVALLCCTAGTIAAQPQAGGPGAAPFALPPLGPAQLGPAGSRGFAIPNPGLPPLAPTSPPRRRQPPGPPGDRPMRVLTDTREYCLHLAQMVAQREAQLPALRPGEHALAVTGRRMCERGLLIGGLERLRVAWRLLGQSR